MCRPRRGPRLAWASDAAGWPFFLAHLCGKIALKFWLSKLSRLALPPGLAVAAWPCRLALPPWPCRLALPPTGLSQQKISFGSASFLHISNFKNGLAIKILLKISKRQQNINMFLWWVGWGLTRAAVGQNVHHSKLSLLPPGGCCLKYRSLGRVSFLHISNFKNGFPIKILLKISKRQQKCRAALLPPETWDCKTCVAGRPAWRALSKPRCPSPCATGVGFGNLAQGPRRHRQRWERVPKWTERV